MASLVFKDAVGNGALVFDTAKSTPRLVFKDAPGTTGALVFNAGIATGGASNATVSIGGVDAAIGDLAGVVFLGAPVGVAIAGVIGDLAGGIAVRYDSNTARPTVCAVTARWQDGVGLSVGVSDTAQDSRHLPVGVDTGWREAVSLGMSLDVRWTNSLHRHHGMDVVYQEAMPLDLSLVGRFADSMRTHTPFFARFQQGTGRDQSLDARFQQALRLHRTANPRFANGVGLLHEVLDHAQMASKAGRRFGVRYQEAIPPPAGIHVYVPPVELDPCYVPSPSLVFTDTYRGMVFFCERHTTTPPVPDAPLYILPARVYMTVHHLIAHRLPDMLEIPLYAGTTINADAGSFAWSLSASGPEDLFDLLAPTAGFPRQIQINLDGLVWVFAVKPPAKSGRFGKRAASITGSSVTSLLGAPWMREVSYNNTSAATAQQLAAQALDLTGVALDWGITDWLVPAYAWSRSGTPLSAVQAIAEAAGGYLQSHRSEPILQVRHPYPLMPDGSPGGPWNWGIGAADIELAPDAIIVEGYGGGDEAEANAVYVSGTTQGVRALVKRSGTAGDMLAAMQTDALITHADAARQRGMAILGKAGPQYDISLELPILTGINQPGVIDVGRLVQVNDPTPWRARVRAVSVTHAMPKARQTITLERHL